MQTTKEISFSSAPSVSFFMVSALVRRFVGELKKRTNGITDSHTNIYNLCILRVSV